MPALLEVGPIYDSRWGPITEVLWEREEVRWGKNPYTPVQVEPEPLRSNAYSIDTLIRRALDSTRARANHLINAVWNFSSATHVAKRQPSR